MQVIGECPSLNGHTREIDTALGRSLTNLKYYHSKKVTIIYTQLSVHCECIQKKEEKSKGRSGRKKDAGLQGSKVRAFWGRRLIIMA